MWYFAVVLAVVAADQALKYLIDARLAAGQSVPAPGGLFDITYVQNTGAAFSSFRSHPEIVIAVSTVLVAAGLIYLARHRADKRRLLMVSLALMIGGGIGNLLDRVIRGWVIDYIDFRVWPVFNLADICVCVGCGLLCIFVIFVDRKSNG